jgi:D-serine deaminase-like pyridoxal phosphate-dependent protein
MSSAPEQRPPRLAALLGQGVATIDTPALVVDLDAMARNLQRMADYAQAHGVKLRPHAKMHKSAALSRRQLQAGAVGMCVQKTSEAEALATGGVSDLYISNEVIALPKLQRVAALARALQARGGRLAIAVDSRLGVEHLAQAMGAGANLIDVFIELDVGQRRCGVAEPADVLPLAQAIARHPALRLAGLQAYNGSAQHLRSVAERRAALDVVIARVQEARRLVEAAGLALPLVTGAGSGTFGLEATSGVFGELQAGSYLFMDADYARNQADPAQPAFEHALFVKTQVMSVSAGHVVVDAGHKSHAIDSGLPRVHGEALEATGCSDEHTTLRTTGSAPLPTLGSTLWLIPGHCDPTVNLHDWLIGVRGGLLAGTVAELIRVDARGCLD